MKENRFIYQNKPNKRKDLDTCPANEKEKKKEHTNEIMYSKKYLTQNIDINKRLREKLKNTTDINEKKKRAAVLGADFLEHTPHK